MNRNKWRYLPAILWTILIVMLSTNTGVQDPFGWDEFIAIDKVGHLVFYCIHSFLLLWAIVKTKKQRTKKFFLLAFLLSAILGVTMEIIQYSFYPNRYFEIFDIIANIIGSLIGITIFLQLRIENLLDFD